MSQTTYANTFSSSFAGTLGDAGYSRKAAWINDEGDEIPAGIAVAFKSAGKVDLPDAAGDDIVGFVANSMARDGDNLSGTLAAYEDQATIPVVEEGAIHVHAEENMAVGDPVYVRITSDGGSNTQLGKVRNDSDSGRAILLRGARVTRAGTSTSPPVVYFSRSVQNSVDVAESSDKRIELTAAAEAANAIVVTGQVKYKDGSLPAAAVEVCVRSLAVTDNKGDLTVTVGTSKKVVNPATGENVAWITTNATGGFAVSVANDAAEDTLVTAEADNAVSAALKLTYA
jgi:hypothetical protein